MRGALLPSNCPVAGSISATRRASRCFDGDGLTTVTLRCDNPDPDERIQTLTAFTGISQYNACSYRPWDCIIQVRECIRNAIKLLAWLN